jgi:putative membrane protein
VTIPHFSDHAANERTFLAWVRTAIAVMAFGFLVERFDIFLKIAAHSLGAETLTQRGQLAGSVVGLTLIVAGALMVLVAMRRFLLNRTGIMAEATQAPGSVGLDLALAGLIVLLGIGLAGYLARALITAHSP